MTIATLADVLQPALRQGHAVAGLVTLGWEDMRAYVEAAESEGVPVTFANPKEGALTWVCGAMMHKDAPHPDRAHDLVDALLSEEAGKWIIGYNGYGHSNSKSFEQFTDAELDELGLSSNPSEILNAGKFQVPQTQEFETAINSEFEQIKAGF